MANVRKSVDSKFKQQETYKPRDNKEKRLVKVIASLKNEQVASAFLRDLMTLPEIEEFANRLEIASLLLQGHSYKEIAEKTKVSTTTVTRVAHWLYRGCGGYNALLSDSNLV